LDWLIDGLSDCALSRRASGSGYVRRFQDNMGHDAEAIIPAWNLLVGMESREVDSF